MLFEGDAELLYSTTIISEIRRNFEKLQNMCSTNFIAINSGSENFWGG